MSALYQLVAEYREAAEKLSESDLDDQTISDTLESMKGDVEVKTTNIGFVIRNLEAETEAIKAAEEAMAKRRKAKENNIKRMKAYVLSNMLATGINRIESPYFSISVRNNAESVVIDAESQIPDDYMREIPARYEPDKTAIKSAIQEGFNVPGCHLERSKSLQIK